VAGVKLLGPAEIRELAARLDVRPTKTLGQNFVHDAGSIRKIVAAANLTPGERVLEVGPGLGSLTLGLLAAGHSVTAIEIDPKLAAALPQTAATFAPGAELAVILHDAMTITPAEIPEPLPTALVANLPYNTAVPILLHLLEALPSLQTALVMVQAEVADRIAAAPGSKIYGVPSAKVAWYGRAWRAGNISRNVFWPVPNVDSALVAFHRHPDFAAQLGDSNANAGRFHPTDSRYESTGAPELSSERSERPSKPSKSPTILGGWANNHRSGDAF